MPLKNTASVRQLIAIQAAMARFKDRLIDHLLGPAARAGWLVADDEAAMIGLHARPPWRHRSSAPFFNHLQIMTCTS